MSQFIEVSAEAQELSGLCGHCNGACCRAGTAISLFPLEANQFLEAGTSLRRLSREETQNYAELPGREWFMLESDCGNLDPQTNRCNNYDQRPHSCREFEMGGVACVQIRKEHLRTGPVLLPMPTFLARD